MRFYIDPDTASWRACCSSSPKLSRLASPHFSSGASLQQPVWAQVAEQKHTQPNEERSSSIYKPPLYSWVFLKLWKRTVNDFLSWTEGTYCVAHNTKAVLTQNFAPFFTGLITNGSTDSRILWIYSVKTYININFCKHFYAAFTIVKTAKTTTHRLQFNINKTIPIRHGQIQIKHSCT